MLTVNQQDLLSLGTLVQDITQPPIPQLVTLPHPAWSIPWAIASVVLLAYSTHKADLVDVKRQQLDSSIKGLRDYIATHLPSVGY